MHKWNTLTSQPFCTNCLLLYTPNHYQIACNPNGEYQQKQQMKFPKLFKTIAKLIKPNKWRIK